MIVGPVGYLISKGMSNFELESNFFVKSPELELQTLGSIVPSSRNTFNNGELCCRCFD